MRRDPHIPPTMRGWLHKQVGQVGTVGLGWGRGGGVVRSQVTGEGGSRGTMELGVLWGGVRGVVGDQWVLKVRGRVWVLGIPNGLMEFGEVWGVRVLGGLWVLEIFGGVWGGWWCWWVLGGPKALGWVSGGSVFGVLA